MLTADITQMRNGCTERKWGCLLLLSVDHPLQLQQFGVSTIRVGE